MDFHAKENGKNILPLGDGAVGVGGEDGGGGFAEEAVFDEAESFQVTDDLES